jgi:SagB-type dehydrogenase family enzyme
MTRESIAEFYHQATKYDPETLSRRQKQLDWGRQPVPFKEYEEGTQIPLSDFLPTEPAQLTDDHLRELTSREGSPAGLGDLSHLLYFTNGVTEIVQYPDRPFYMRAAPSAGGLYPTELYLVSRGSEALGPGLYNYQVRTHSLVRLLAGDVWPKLTAACFGHPALAEAQIAVVMTGIFFRSAWRYEDRAYRRILLDTGHVFGNLALYAPLCGQAAVPISGFADEALGELLFLDSDEEGPLLVVALLPEARAQAAPFEPKALCSESEPASAVPEGKRLLALHDASGIPAGADPRPLPPAEAPRDTQRTAWMQLTSPVKVETRPFDWGNRLSETILRRRSTRNYAGEAFTIQQLAAILSLQDGDQATLLCSHLLETYVAIHRVDDLDPGCYYRERGTGTLRQIRFKDLTEEVQFLCLNQDLGGDAAAVVFHTANLPAAIAACGDRAYRYLHLDAGHLGQRLNLAATCLGLGASGIGGFFDDRVNELLGIPESEAVVYITTLGVPTRRGGGA